MNRSKNFGLIGKGISYSFSKKYFEEKFRKLFLADHRYELYDLDSLEGLRELIEKENLTGFNVTIPYKEKIIPFLDELSPEVQEIGAVNTVKVVGGKLIGYNTDTYGFEKTLTLHKSPSQRTALILGSGGAAKAVRFVLDKAGIPSQTVSRSGPFTFDLLTSEIVKEHSIIVQCTPVGTFPNTCDVLPFPFQALDSSHLVIDLIYNPSCTEFINRASAQEAKCINGYFMLEQQAEKAWQLWLAES